MLKPCPPVMEVERFFPGPPNRRRASGDAQADAVDRLVRSCERIVPQLNSLETLERFIHLQQDPPRARRRISLALAIEQPDCGLRYGQVGRSELETFRQLAQRRPASVVWVFS